MPVHVYTTVRKANDVKQFFEFFIPMFGISVDLPSVSKLGVCVLAGDLNAKLL